MPRQHQSIEKQDIHASSELQRQNYFKSWRILKLVVARDFGLYVWCVNKQS